MKKNRGMAYTVLGIAFILFNVLAFVIPTEKTPTFWTAYIFSVIAFAAQIGIWHFTFKGAETLKSKFLGIPLIHIKNSIFPNSLIFQGLSPIKYQNLMYFPLFLPL